MATRPLVAATATPQRLGLASATVASLSERGRAAVARHTGAVSRGSGSAPDLIVLRSRHAWGAVSKTA
jgi:hypothetical protein